MESLTGEQAFKLFNSDWWKDLTPRERATFQLYEERLCMPLGVYHKALEETLGRSVQIHEMRNRQGLMDELRGNAPPPTRKDIINLIPKDKLILIS